MFCSKCGSQLPDDAKFCASCGNSVETPSVVTNEQAVENQPATEQVHSEPIMEQVQNEPIMEQIQNEPVMEQIQNQTSEEIPQGEPEKKKSKAPLFIGLGIGAAVIVIIVIVLILVLGGDDESKKESSTSGKETETSGQKETGSGEEADLEDAEQLAEEFIKAIKGKDYDAVEDCMYPAMIEYIKEESAMDIEDFIDMMSYMLIDENGDFLDYKVIDVNEYDGESFEDGKTLLEDYDEYVEPEAFAAVDVEFTYEDQTGVVTVYMAQADNQYYVYDFDTSDFDVSYGNDDDDDIDDDGNGGSVVGIDDDDDNDVDIDDDNDADAGQYYGDLSVADMIASNSMSIYDDGVEGNTYTETGFTMVVPADWEQVEMTSGIQWTSPDLETAFEVAPAVSFTGYTVEEYLDLICSSYSALGMTEIEVGNFAGTYERGYYVSYKYGEGDEIIYGISVTYFNEDETTAYCVSVMATDEDSETFDTAMYSVGSLKITE